jgi:hypothetical protein
MERHLLSFVCGRGRWWEVKRSRLHAWWIEFCTKLIILRQLVFVREEICQLPQIVLVGVHNIRASKRMILVVYSLGSTGPCQSTIACLSSSDNLVTVQCAYNNANTSYSAWVIIGTARLPDDIYKNPK